MIALALFSGALAVFVITSAAWAGVVPAIVAGLVFLGVAGGGQIGKRIQAGVRRDAGKGTAVFTLSLGDEAVALEPGKTWMQLDHFKWVARGLIEAPQSFLVSSDGSVAINAARISIADPEGATKLEDEINKRHEGTVAHKAATVFAAAHRAPAPAASNQRRFRVKLDHWGHMVIEWGQGLDREETGLRGLATLIANGMIRKPDRIHVDALQRGIELDEAWYECSAAGAKELEEALNTRYAVTARNDKRVAIEIKENHAASAGFDIHFTMLRAGVPFEVKGHLTQEYLDLLQDQEKCHLIHPGIHLLISPPFLLLRRRRPDLGEEKIAELPDVNLLRIKAAQLEQLLNHPLICRGADGAGTAAVQTGNEPPTEFAELRVVRNPEDKALLWLECVTSAGRALEPKAFTHHNVAELQQAGIFLPHLDVCLSLDHRRLSILNRQTNQEETLTLDPRSHDEDLRSAGRMLTRALKPVVTAAGRELATPLPAAELATVAKSEPATEPVPTEMPKQVEAKARPAERIPPKPGEHPAPLAAAKPQLDPITMLFRETDAVRINQEIFRRLGVWLGIAAQDLHLTLEMVFENRRFEVLNFERREINNLTGLRGEDFYGFYLSHVSERKVVLVYACNGMHLEWGPDKCVLQPGARFEAEEYKGSALLGLAQDRKDEFVFIVQPAFKEWVTPREQPYVVENLRFLTVAAVAAAPGEYRLIWPEPTPAGA